MIIYQSGTTSSGILGECLMVPTRIVSHIALLHVAINISNVTESLGFYRDVLGMHIVREETDEVQQIWLGRGEDTEVELRVDVDADVGPAGMDHVAIMVDDVDGICDALSNDRIEMAPEDFPTYGTRAAFVRDPDGYTCELIQDVG